jgi:hypothetical protein
MLWWLLELKICDYLPENQISSNTDTLRISEKYQKYRYAKKTQLFLGLKKYRLEI